METIFCTACDDSPECANEFEGTDEAALGAGWELGEYGWMCPRAAGKAKTFAEALKEQGSEGVTPFFLFRKKTDD